MSKKKPLSIKVNETIIVHPGGIYKSVVVKSGNGAAIRFYKRFIGKEVLVILEDSMKKKRTEEDELKEILDDRYEYG